MADVKSDDRDLVFSVTCGPSSADLSRFLQRFQLGLLSISPMKWNLRACSPWVVFSPVFQISQPLALKVTIFKVYTCNGRVVNRFEIPQNVRSIFFFYFILFLAAVYCQPGPNMGPFAWPFAWPFNWFVLHFLNDDNILSRFVIVDTDQVWGWVSRCGSHCVGILLSWVVVSIVILRVTSWPAGDMDIVFHGRGSVGVAKLAVNQVWSLLNYFSCYSQVSDKSASIVWKKISCDTHFFAISFHQYRLHCRYSGFSHLSEPKH